MLQHQVRVKPLLLLVVWSTRFACRENWRLGSDSAVAPINHTKWGPRPQTVLAPKSQGPLSLASCSHCGHWMGARQWLSELIGRTQAAPRHQRSWTCVSTWAEGVLCRSIVRLCWCITGGFKPPCALARHCSKSKYSRIKWKDFTAVLSFCFFFLLLLPIHSYSRAAWAQLSFSSDSKGMCSGQPPRSQSCWKVSPFAGEHTTNLCFGPEEAAECARNNQAKKEGKKSAVGFANERQILDVWFLCHEIKKEEEEEEGEDEKWRQINIIRPGLDTTTALSLPRIPELKKNENQSFPLFFFPLFPSHRPVLALSIITTGQLRIYCVYKRSSA